MSDEPIYSVLSGKDCCTGNLNISGMSSGNGCYTYFGANDWRNESGGYFQAYMNGSSLIVMDLFFFSVVANITYDVENPPCPITGTHPILGGGNATVTCGC